MSETTEASTYCCKFCEYIDEHRDVFKDKVLINRIHKCKILDILTETQYIEMYERMRNKQIEAYNKCVENKDNIEFRNRRQEINNEHYQKRKSKQQTEHNDT